MPAKLTTSPSRRSVKATRALSLGSSCKTRRWVAPFPDMAFDSIPRGSSFGVRQYVSSPLKMAHGIRQRSDFLDRDAHFVAVLEPQRRILRHTYSVRRAGKNGGAREQRRALAQEFDQRWDVAHHVAGVAVLHHATVHRGLDAQPAGVRDGLRSHEARADWGKRIETFSSAPLAAALLQLPIARAHVVAARVAGDILESALAAHVFTSFADDDHEFAFIVQLYRSGARGNSNGRAGILSGVRAFGEYNGLVARAHADFVCVAAIVLPDAPNHDGKHRR